MKKITALLTILISVFCIPCSCAEYGISFSENSGYIFDRDAAVVTVTAEIGDKVRLSSDGVVIFEENMASETKAFSLSALDLGKHSITAEIQSGGEVVYSSSRNITLIEFHKPQLYDALSRVGVVQHRGQASVQDTERIELMHKAGISWARDLLSWWSYETGKDIWNSDYSDKVCKVYAEHGTKLHLTLCHYNNLYNKEDEQGYAPYTKEQLERFSEYVRRVVSNYPDIKEFEIYNEPNRDGTWNPEANAVAYTNLVKVASSVIKELCPDAKIIIGAVSNTNGTDTGSSKGDGMRFLKQLGELGMFNYADAISAHPYTYSSYSDSRYSDFIDIYSDIRDCDGFFGWKDFQITETGFPTVEKHSIDERTEAINIIKSYVYGDAGDAEKVFVYEFVSSGTNNTNQEHQFGILNYDRTAKEAYPAVAAYTNIISGADFIGKIKSGNADIFLYQKEGEVLGVMWSSSAQKVTFNQENEIDCFDLFGNRVSVTSNTVTVTNEPVYVVGIDKSYAQKAACNSVSELYEKAAAISKKELTVPDLSGDILNTIDNNYQLIYDTALDNENDRLLFAAYIHRAGVKMASLYPLFDEGVVFELSDSKIKRVEESLSSLQKGSELPKTAAILKKARDFYNAASELDGFDGGNLKRHCVYSKYIISQKLVALAEYIRNDEEADFDKLLKFCIDSAKIKTSGNHTASGEITNMSDGEISFSLTVYDNEGNSVSETKEITLLSDEKYIVELDFVVTDKLPGGQYFYELRAETDKTRLSGQYIMVDIEALGPVDAVATGGIKELSDDADCFWVDGMKFLLIDVGDKSSAKYFVMAADKFANRPFSKDLTQKFNPDNPNNIAYYLNNQFVLPEIVTKHIDKNHIWRTEAGFLGGDVPGDYDTVCGVSLLSYTEFSKYSHKIGWNDTGVRWWLRTARGTNSWWDKGLVVYYDKQRVGEYNIDSPVGVRPVFWLDESFFKEEGIENIGANVKRKISGDKKLYSDSFDKEAEGVYTPSGIAGFIKNSKSGSVKVVKDGENGYLMVSKPAEAGKDSLNFNFSGLVEELDVYTVKFSYMAASDTNMNYKFNVGSAESYGANLESTNTYGNIRYYDGTTRVNALSYQAGIWNDYAIVIRKTKGTYDLYINDILIQKDAALVSGENVTYDILRFWMPSQERVGAFSVDNIMIEEGDAENLVNIKACVDGIKVTDEYPQGNMMITLAPTAKGLGTEYTAAVAVYDVSGALIEAKIIDITSVDKSVLCNLEASKNTKILIMVFDSISSLTPVQKACLLAAENL